MAPSSARAFSVIDFAQRTGREHCVAHQCHDGRPSDAQRLSDKSKQREVALAAGETGKEDALVFQVRQGITWHWLAGNVRESIGEVIALENC